MKSKIWRTLLLLGLSVTMALGITACGDDGDGDGAKPEVVYDINSLDEFKAIANTNKSYKLNVDLDLSSESNWSPIANFKGKLDGNNHKISNLTMTDCTGENIGLFGYSEATISNLTIEDASISTYSDSYNIGILVGKLNKGHVTNVVVSGSVSATSYQRVGGIIGWLDYGTIKNCTNNADVVGEYNVGGIVGDLRVNADNASYNNVNNGTITGEKERVGGVIGYLNSNDSKVYSFSKNTNNGEVEAPKYVGGIIGNIAPEIDFTMNDLHNTASITGDTTGEGVGGIIGRADGLSANITNCTNTADITGGKYVGGYTGYTPNATIIGLTNDVTVTGTEAVGGISGEGGILQNCINNGEVISTEPGYTDSTYRSALGGIAGYAKGAVNCENKIDITVDHNGRYVGGIIGYVNYNADNKLNGNINNGSVLADDANYIGGIAGYVKVQATTLSDNTNKASVTGNENVGGIFGYIGGNKDIKLTLLKNTADAEIVGNSAGKNTGGIIGQGYKVTSIVNSSNLADVTGGNYVGGIIGYSPNTLVKGSNNTVTVTGNGYIGGIAGFMGVAEDCTNSGEIVSNMYITENSKNYAYVGGIAGYATGIDTCENNIDISISYEGRCVGGLVGYLYRTSTNKITENKNYADVSGDMYTGGIIGYLRSDGSSEASDCTNSGDITGSSYVGGVYGYIQSTSPGIRLNKMYNSGVVTNTGDYTGGIIAYADYVQSLITSENLANITGANYVGGYVGYMTNGTVESLHNQNTITGKAYLGGIVGRGSILKECTNGGTITSTSGIVDGTNFKAYVGGVAGYAEGLVKCTNDKAISLSYAGNYVGGVAGEVRLNSDNNLKNNVNNRAVSSTGDYVGGIVGYLHSATRSTTYMVSNESNYGAVSGRGSVGGVYGFVAGHKGGSYPYPESKFTLDDMYNEGTVTGTADRVGGIVGNADYFVTQLLNSSSIADVTGGIYVGGYIGYGFDTVVKLATNVNTIVGKAYVGGIAGYAGIIEQCTNDGSVSATTGKLNDTITEAYLGGIAGYCEGLVDCTNSKNIVVTYEGNYVGGLAGYIKLDTDNKLKDNANTQGTEGTAVVSSRGDYVGGIAGYIGSVSRATTYMLDNDNNVKNVSGDNYVGGLYGRVHGHTGGSYPYPVCYFQVTNANNTGNIVATGDYAGGLVGEGTNLTLISLSKNTGDVTGNGYVGGFVGKGEGADIQARGETDKNTSTIVAVHHMGGFAGLAHIVSNAVNDGIIKKPTNDSSSVTTDKKVYMGGIAGSCYGLKTCTNNKDIACYQCEDYVGGLAGYVTMYDTDCLSGNVNKGNVGGGEYIGGIAGYVTSVVQESTFIIDNNINLGHVAGADSEDVDTDGKTGRYVGGIAGYVRGFQGGSYPYPISSFQIINCTNGDESGTNDVDISGSTYVGGLVGGYERLNTTDEGLVNTNKNFSVGVTFFGTGA